MKFSRYTLIARFFPAIITSLPLIILSGFVLTVDYLSLFDNLRYLKITGLATTPVILFYLFSQINRFIAKEYFQKKYFKGEIEMPTTTFLLNQDCNLSNEYKSSIKRKVETDFDVNLPSAADEINNLVDTRVRYAEAVGMIRNSVGNGNLLLQHNIEYGFVRNLIGGSLVSFFLALINIVLFSFIWDSVSAVAANIILAIVYLIFILSSKYLIERFGEIYAKRLFQEYMS